MERFAQEQQQWVVQPLLDVGVDLADIRVLVFQLAFDDIVAGGRSTLAGLGELVADRSPAVQAAWAEMIGRMLVVQLLS